MSNGSGILLDKRTIRFYDLREVLAQYVDCLIVTRQFSTDVAIGISSDRGCDQNYVRRVARN